MSSFKKNNSPSRDVKNGDLEELHCPLCVSQDTSIMHIFPPFKVVRCKDCDLIYLNPRLRESVMERFYRDGNYFSGDSTGYAEYSAQEESLRVTFRRFLRELRDRGMTSGRLLEVGCGYGYFLDEAKNFFSYSAGTELSEEAGKAANKQTGAEIFIGTIYDLPPKFKNFDIIVLINVIEHVYSPIDFATVLKQLLRRGGEIIIATPDIGSFWYTLMRKRWPSFKIPEHVVFYTEKTLTSLLERAGFQNISKIPFHHAFPLSLITSKIGMPLSVKGCQRPLWVPRTMVALAGKKP
jgi:2-polyprenyl-3-methyl-5-hydroxy-6-metoxy-1,4-benzoquinol methylase